MQLSIEICYDSEYAARLTRRIWRARSNFSLVSAARTAFDAAKAAGCRIQWRKVASHTGDFLNDRADVMADLGARLHGPISSRAEEEALSMMMGGA